MLIRRKMIAVILLAVTLFTAAGCLVDGTGNGTAGKETSHTNTMGDKTGGFPYTFTDSTGTEVTLSKRPEKVAVLFSSYAEMWKDAGGVTNVTVGEAVERGFADSNVTLVDAGVGHTSIDRETLINAEPDFVIGTADYEVQKETVDYCRSIGIPAAAFQVESFEDYLNMFQILCCITGDEERYQVYGTDVAQQIAQLRESVETEQKKSGNSSPEILFVRAGSSAKSTKAKNSEDNFVCGMLKELGVINIADSSAKLQESLSLETIVEKNPDELFITTMGDEQAAKDFMNSLLESEGWKELDCVKSGNVTFLPKELFHYKPNARWAEAYDYLIKSLY